MVLILLDKTTTLRFSIENIMAELAIMSFLLRMRFAQAEHVFQYLHSSAYRKV